MLKFPLEPDRFAKFEKVNKIIISIGYEGSHQTNLMFVSIYEDNRSFPKSNKIILGYFAQLEYYTINGENRAVTSLIFS
jgi:hypothetical protein